MPDLASEVMLSLLILLPLDGILSAADAANPNFWNSEGQYTGTINVQTHV